MNTKLPTIEVTEQQYFDVFETHYDEYLEWAGIEKISPIFFSNGRGIHPPHVLMFGSKKQAILFKLRWL